MIYGKPAISFCLEKLPESVDTIHFVVAPHLIKYNFAEIVINEFKTKKCIFHYLPYFTRGAIESAFIGTNDISENDEENVIFLDNDILYNFPENLFTNRQDPFIGYSIDKTNNDKYSFIKKDENKQTALGTSKINYIDPRISAAWCDKHGVPLEKIFNRSLCEKLVLEN